MLDEDDTTDCLFCTEPLTDYDILEPCLHRCHLSCVSSYAFSRGMEPQCPVCRSPVYNVEGPEQDERQILSEQRSSFNADQMGLQLYREEENAIREARETGELKKAQILEMQLSFRRSGSYEFVEKLNVCLDLLQSNQVWKSSMELWCVIFLFNFRHHKHKKVIQSIINVSKQVAESYDQNQMHIAVGKQKKITKMILIYRINGHDLYNRWLNMFNSEFKTKITTHLHQLRFSPRYKRLLETVSVDDVEEDTIEDTDEEQENNENEDEQEDEQENNENEDEQENNENEDEQEDEQQEDEDCDYHVLHYNQDDDNNTNGQVEENRDFQLIFQDSNINVVSIDPFTPIAVNSDNITDVLGQILFNSVNNDVVNDIIQQLLNTQQHNLNDNLIESGILQLQNQPCPLSHFNQSLSSQEQHDDHQQQVNQPTQGVLTRSRARLLSEQQQQPTNNNIPSNNNSRRVRSRHQ